MKTKNELNPKGKSLSYKVAYWRLMWHAEMVDINNILNQLGLRSDEKAETVAKKHVMTVVNDVAPRLVD